jgi:hypothetical protein
MKKIIIISFLLIVAHSHGQTFEITNGQSMCMIGKGKGQDATINPYADKDYSYALIENIGSVDFGIRIELTEEDLKQFLVKSNDRVIIKLYRNSILYIDALTSETAEARIYYTINEDELPPKPPKIN